MKDIRDDLRERLEEIKNDRAQFHRRLEALTEKENTIQALLEAEETRWGSQIALPMGLPTQANGQRGSTAHSRFILDALRDGRARSLQEN